MAFEGSSFNLYNDAALTSLFSGTLSLINYTDFSDNPQDFVLYLGSNTPNRALQAQSNPGVDSITIVPTDILTRRQSNTAYSVGKVVQPSVSNGNVYKATTAGTTGSSAPVWPTTGVGSTVVDGSVIWQLYAAHHATSEIKLATTSAGLAGATPGGSLSLGVQINSGVANAKAIYIRITNAVATVSNNTGNEELGINYNALLEVAL